MSSNQDNLICMCGHLKKDHYQNETNVQLVCQIKKKVGKFLDEDAWEDDCYQFTPDNLTYLVQKYESQQ